MLLHVDLVRFIRAAFAAGLVDERPGALGSSVATPGRPAFSVYRWEPLHVEG
jgi:hypothetical protein